MSKIYDDAKEVTLKQIRELKVGDIIKAFYTDTEEPVLHFVTSQWGNSKTGVLRDIDTVPLSAFGQRSSDVRGCRSLNTDKWVRVAHGANLVDTLYHQLDLAKVFERTKEISDPDTKPGRDEARNKGCL